MNFGEFRHSTALRIRAFPGLLDESIAAFAMVPSEFLASFGII